MPSEPASEPRSLVRLDRDFLRLTALNILANLTVPLVGLVDLAILGHLDDVRHLAGVALGSVVFDYLYWSFGFLRMATTGLAAQAVGRGDGAESSRVLARSALVAVAAGGLLLLVRGPLGDASFALLGGTAAVETSGRAYFDARILGAPAALLNLALLGWFLGRAEGRAVLAITAVGNLTNLGLDVLFVLQLGLEARGAGLASMVSQYLALVLALALWWRRRTPIGGWRSAFDRRALGMLRLGRDILIRTLCLTTVFALFTNWSALLGTTVLAANALLLRIVTAAAYLVDGAAYATESLAGIALGRGDRAALGRLLCLAMLVGLAFEAAVAALMVLAPGPVLGLLTVHGEVIARATADRWWLLAVMLPGALAYVYDGFFLGLTSGRLLRNAMLVSLAAFLVPGWLALRQGSNAWLWLALAIFMAVRAGLLARAVPAALDTVRT